MVVGMDTKFQHGFIVGKFMPLHNGHRLVIDTALEQCEQLTICLMSRGDEPIPGVLRLGWLQVLCEGNPCTVVHHTTELPQDESGYGHWNDYLQSIRTICTDAYDAVFSSEAYGERLARDWGAEHVLVDQARISVPVSGTEIRANPHQYFEHLPAIVRQYYEH